MKLLKIFLLFVVLVGGIFLVMLWTGGNGSTPPPSLGEPINPDEKCAEIRNAWDKETNWNEQLLKIQLQDLKQDVSLGRYDFQDDAETVQNTIRESATDRLCEAIFREFHSSSCNDNLVTKNFAGVQTLSDEFGMENDERLKKVRAVKAVYDKITAFVNSKHTIVAHYNADNNSWVSFSSLSQGIITTAANYRNDTIYKEDLSHIKRFIDGLNDSYIRRVVSSQESTFYNDLADQIITHFQSLMNREETITETNLSRFKKAYNDYTNETKLKVKEMSKARGEFKKKYEEIKKRDETKN